MISNRTFQSPNKVVVRPILVGIAILVLFFGAVVVWASAAKLSSAAIAAGVVNVEGARKTIQHFEGGIVQHIYVHDGQIVEKNDVLIALDNTNARAELEILRNRLQISKAREARLLAERDGIDNIDFSHNRKLSDLKSIQAKQHPRPKAHINLDQSTASYNTDYSEQNSAESAETEEQRAIFSLRRSRFLDQIEKQTQRITSLENQISARQAEYRNRNRQLRLLRDELANITDLYSRGLVSRSKVYDLGQREAELQGKLHSDIALIAEAKENITRVNLSISEIREQRSERAEKALEELRDDLIVINQRIRTAENIANRTTIRAPIRGTVINMQVHTTGGVIKAGEAILDIVPSDSKLVIDAKVEVKDRDIVSVGLPAEIRFSAFNQRSSLPVEGVVASVSADSLLDTQSGVSHYLARVELKENPKATLEGMEIYPGMQAEVVIVTGDRTALEYLMQPIVRSMSRTLTEY